MNNKKLLLGLLTLFYFCFCVTIVSAQTWTGLKKLPDSREGAISFAVNGKVYWGGGTNTGVTDALGDFYEYDPAANNWTKKANMPEVRAYGIAFVVNGKGYIGLGKKTGTGNSSYLTSLYEYDSAGDKWIKKSDMPLGFGVISAACFVANDKAYVLGGVNSNYQSNGRMHEYDPTTDTWIEKKGYPITNQGANYCRMPFAFGINGKGYVACGETRKTSGVGTQYIKKTFEYDPASDSWTPKADFPGTERHNGASFVIGNMGYCGIGTSRDVNYNNVFYNDFYTYSPSADKWTKIADYPTSGKVHPSTAVINNIAYVGGGSEWQQGHTDVWYKYTTTTSVATTATKNVKATAYPNPAKDIIYVDSKSVFDNYEIYNALGIIVAKGKFETSNSIDLNDISHGNYFLELNSKKGEVAKLLFQKK